MAIREHRTSPELAHAQAEYNAAWAEFNEATTVLRIDAAIARINAAEARLNALQAESQGRTWALGREDLPYAKWMREARANGR